MTKTSAAEVVATSGRRGFETTILAGRHQLIADEPISLGGTDRGPNPYSFLLAALGSCIVITLQMYADRKGWSLDGVRVALTHSRIHAKDCEDCQSTSGRIDRIEVNLSLEGDLTESQIEGLIDIAGRCPVHRSLSREVSIRTTTL